LSVSGSYHVLLSEEEEREIDGKEVSWLGEEGVDIGSHGQNLLLDSQRPSKTNVVSSLRA
jgi:hypothetical protein